MFYNFCVVYLFTLSLLRTLDLSSRETLFLFKICFHFEVKFELSLVMKLLTQIWQGNRQHARSRNIDSKLYLKCSRKQNMLGFFLLWYKLNKGKSSFSFLSTLFSIYRECLVVLIMGPMNLFLCCLCVFFCHCLSVFFER